MAETPAERIPVQADFLYAYSTAPGKKKKRKTFCPVSISFLN